MHVLSDQRALSDFFFICFTLIHVVVVSPKFALQQSCILLQAAQADK